MKVDKKKHTMNPINPELNPICYLLALLGAHYFLHVSRIRVKLLTFRRLMSYIYIYDINRLRVKIQSEEMKFVRRVRGYVTLSKIKTLRCSCRHLSVAC
jgi:hypothetical protein